MGMDIEQIKELANIMKMMDINVIEIKEDNTQIRFERAYKKNMYIGDRELPIENAFLNHEIIEEQKEIAVAKERSERMDGNNIKEIKSPIVGFFYSSPSPNHPEFVRLGDKVKKGQTICIIEAMKLFNEITAEEDAEIIEICVKNGEIVEFGQTIFRYR